MFARWNGRAIREDWPGITQRREWEQSLKDLDDSLAKRVAERTDQLLAPTKRATCCACSSSRPKSTNAGGLPLASR